jgi:twinkle protein
MELTAQSIYGGVKASQEADNILILQNNRGRSGLLQGKKYIQVVKNRFDGELGILPLYFDKDSQSYVKKDKPKNNHLDPGVSSTNNPSAEAATPASPVLVSLENPFEFQNVESDARQQSKNR